MGDAFRRNGYLGLLVVFVFDDSLNIFGSISGRAFIAGLLQLVIIGRIVALRIQFFGFCHSDHALFVCEYLYKISVGEIDDIGVFGRRIRDDSNV